MIFFLFTFLCNIKITNKGKFDTLELLTGLVHNRVLSALDFKGVGWGSGVGWGVSLPLCVFFRAAFTTNSPSSVATRPRTHIAIYTHTAFVYTYTGSKPEHAAAPIREGNNTHSVHVPSVHGSPQCWLVFTGLVSLLWTSLVQLNMFHICTTVAGYC